MLGGPPAMWGGVVLPEFANGCALPTAAGFGPRIGCGDQMRKMLADIGRHDRAVAMKIKLSCQFIGHQCEVQRLAMVEKLAQEIASGLGPRRFMIAARGLGGIAVFMAKPLVTEPVELGQTDMQPLGRRRTVELTAIKGR